MAFGGGGRKARNVEGASMGGSDGRTVGGENGEWGGGRCLGMKWASNVEIVASGSSVGNESKRGWGVGVDNGFYYG